MKPSPARIVQMVENLSAMKFFPATDSAKRVIMELIERMVGTEKQLAWLEGELINRVGEWPGPAELRALFCTRYRPADGIAGKDCAIPGYTPGDYESQRALPPVLKPEQAVLQLAAAKRLL
jgi:hypothetical protein